MTNELNRRQFSTIQRELDGALPMNATLSRVGSCRVTNNNNNNDNNRSAIGCGQSAICNHRSINNGTGSGGSCSDINGISQQLHNYQPQQQQHQQVIDASKMQTPVKSQQPSMRTSKILNISQQTGLNSPPNQQQQHLYQQLTNQLGNRRASLTQNACDPVRTDNNLLVSNLANIRLNDKLAFTSLRAPKSSSSSMAAATGSLNRSLITNNGPNSKASPKSGINTKAQSSSSSSTSSSHEKKHKLLTTTEAQKQQQARAATVGPDSSGGQNGGKSSVWFEYGCV